MYFMTFLPSVSLILSISFSGQRKMGYPLHMNFVVKVISFRVKCESRTQTFFHLAEVMVLYYVLFFVLIDVFSTKMNLYVKDSCYDVCT